MKKRRGIRPYASNTTFHIIEKNKLQVIYYMIEYRIVMSNKSSE